MLIPGPVEPILISSRAAVAAADSGTHGKASDAANNPSLPKRSINCCHTIGSVPYHKFNKQSGTIS